MDRGITHGCETGTFSGRKLGGRGAGPSPSDGGPGEAAHRAVQQRRAALESLRGDGLHGPGGRDCKITKDILLEDITGPTNKQYFPKKKNCLH